MDQGPPVGRGRVARLYPRPHAARRAQIWPPRRAGNGGRLASLDLPSPRWLTMGSAHARGRVARAGRHRGRVRDPLCGRAGRALCAALLPAHVPTASPAPVARSRAPSVHDGARARGSHARRCPNARRLAVALRGRGAHVTQPSWMGPAAGLRARIHGACLADGALRPRRVAASSIPRYGVMFTLTDPASSQSLLPLLLSNSR